MTIFNITFNHKKLYLIGLVLLAISLPLSKFTVNVSMIFLICNWILELGFKRKWQELKSNKAILAFLGAFLVHVIWLINTENYNYAFCDLSNKCILIVYPIIIGTSVKLNMKQIKVVLVWFSLAVMSSTIISVLILKQVIDYPVQNIRDISPFISHIRLSLLINVSIFSLGYILFSKNYKNLKIEKALYGIFILWMIVFLYVLQSLTGIIIFIIVLVGVTAFYSTKITEIVPRLFVQVFLITLFLLFASFVTRSISRFYSIEKVDFENLDEFTVNGNPYIHYKNRKQIENGNYVWLYVCEEELSKEWGRKSGISYYGEDKKGQSLNHTLTRYLSSKGLRKDSIGFSKLSRQDIMNIENGMANHIFENKKALYPRIYDIIWQFDVYKKGMNPAGNSITLRFELAKTGISIIKNNFWYGVGTGDVQDSFDKQYELNNSNLPPKYRLRAHNTYITFFLTFGFVGSLLIWFAIFYPAIKLNGFKNYLFTVFFSIALLSFINEDTIETLIGVTFFSYFYSLFLFGIKNNNKTVEEYEQK